MRARGLRFLGPNYACAPGVNVPINHLPHVYIFYAYFNKTVAEFQAAQNAKLFVSFEEIVSLYSQQEARIHEECFINQ